MEAVTNLTNAASRAIWGDNTKKEENTAQEPVSGETGDVNVGEPYDKGNADPSTASSTSEPKSLVKTTSKEIDPEFDNSPAPSTAAHSSAIPSTSTAGAASAQDSTLKQQGANKLEDYPSSSEAARVQETKKEAEEAAPVNISGPGPQTLEQKTKSGEVTAAGTSEVPQKESHGDGTGEKYVKSTGVVADGGDFDAANPGAGREADRLLEAKGVTREPSSACTATPTSKKENEDTKDIETGTGKLSLKEKIKAKLHKH